MGKTALIANARSHLVARKGSRLEEVARQRPSTPLVWFDTVKSFDARMSELLNTDHDTFIVEGGDGTVLAALTSCYNHAPEVFHKLSFVILPGGSTNLAYEKLGLTRPSVDRLLTLIASIEDNEVPAGKVVSRSALVVERDDVPRAKVGFLLSTGSLALGMDHVQRHMFGDRSRGSAAIALSLLKLAARPRHYLAEDGQPLMRPTQFKPHTPGTPLKAGPHAFSLASTLESLSLDLSPFWGNGNGSIHFTYAPWPPAKLRRAILRSATGYNPEALEHSGYRSFNTDTLSMTVEGPLMLDGELLASTPDQHIRIGTTQEVAFLR